MPWNRSNFVDSLTSVSESTVAVYSRDLRAFVEWAEESGVSGPERVTRLTLRRYLSHLDTNRYARRTIARKASVLRRYYFRWAVNQNMVRSDPSLTLSAPKGQARLPRVLRESEVATLLDDPVARVGDDAPERQARDLAVLELLYGSGLRVSELCGLGLVDIDRSGRGKADRAGQGQQDPARPDLAACPRGISGMA